MSTRIVRWCFQCKALLDTSTTDYGRTVAAGWLSAHDGHVVGAGPASLPEGAAWRLVCPVCGEPYTCADVHQIQRWFVQHQVEEHPGHHCVAPVRATIVTGHLEGGRA